MHASRRLQRRVSRTNPPSKGSGTYLFPLRRNRPEKNNLQRATILSYLCFTTVFLWIFITVALIMRVIWLTFETEDTWLFPSIAGNLWCTVIKTKKICTPPIDALFCQARIALPLYKAFQFISNVCTIILQKKLVRTKFCNGKYGLQAREKSEIFLKKNVSETAHDEMWFWKGEKTEM